ncbi:hypothetical protein M758_7G181400 [Ceratodon purpureus]|nr:hypothetical protein M758_7G181400 [Ceratodon purpureus]
MGSTAIERMAFYGIAMNLVSYLTLVLHEGTAQSITNVWNWGGVAWITPLVGGFIADTYLGRFKTIAIGLLIYQAGMVLLTLTVALPALKPPPCPTQTNCTNVSESSVKLFFFALYLIAIAIGGVKPCISTLGADQFDEEDEKERPMKQSFFNYWWIAVTGGAVVALTVLVYIQDHVGFGWGYGIPTVGMVFSTFLFLAGRRRYRYKLPQGSPLTQVAQVLVAATRKFRVKVPANAALLHETYQPEKRNILHSNNFRFLDKAATPRGEEIKESLAGDEGSVNRWHLCTVTQVEEVKLLVKVLPIWFTTLMFIVTSQQLGTVFLRQGLTLDLHMGHHFKIPPASMELTCSLTALLAIPLYDRFLVPFVRRFTGNERGFTLLQRIGIGLMITVLSMAVAAIVEIKRLGVVKEHGLQLSKSPLPMSVFWLTPQYSIMGLAQVFGWMGMLEFFYDQAPDDMQSIGTALFLSNTGVAHFLCTAIVNILGQVTGRGGRENWIQPVTNQSRLDKYYWLLTIMAAINCVLYFIAAWWYTYKQATRQSNEKLVKVAPSEAPLPE